MAGNEGGAESITGALRAWLLAPVMTKLAELEQKMADVSQVLEDVAAGLSGPLTMSIQELIAENASQAAELAALKGEDARESVAAANVKSAFDGVASLFAAPEVPDVPALPDPNPTTDPAPDVVDPNPVAAEKDNPPS